MKVETTHIRRNHQITRLPQGTPGEEGCIPEETTTYGSINAAKRASRHLQQTAPGNKEGKLGLGHVRVIRDKPNKKRKSKSKTTKKPRMSKYARKRARDTAARKD